MISIVTISQLYLYQQKQLYINTQMGATKSVHLIHHYFPTNQHRWRPIYQKQTHFDHLPSGQTVPVVFDDVTSETGEIYTLKNYHSLQYELQTILFRKRHSQCIVTVHDLLLQPADNLSKIIPDCVTGQNNPFTIIIEHIPYRLSDIGMLRFPQMLYVLEQCFKGLELLWRQFGKGFYIDEGQICFNSQGHCKIWINESLQRNQQNIDSSFLPKYIIQELFQMLETRLEQIPPQSYQKYKLKTVFDKFIHAVNFLQKIKRLQNVNTDFIKSLKKQSSSDSFKAQNNHSLEAKGLQQKRQAKFSLKNSRHFHLRKINKTPMTTTSKEKFSEVSVNYREGRNTEGIEGNGLLVDIYDQDRVCSLKRQEQSSQQTRNSQKVMLLHKSHK